MAKDERRMTFIVVPHGGEDLNTRSFEVSYRKLRRVAVLLLLAALLWVGMAASWFYVAAQAARVPGLVRQVSRLEDDRQRVVQLAEALVRLEEQYEQVRGMLGANQERDTSDLWLPPVGEISTAGENPADSALASLPRTWPLTRRGFITREHLGRVPGQHPGIDIAVAEGSRIHAAGAGIVVEAGEDAVYGKFVRIRHEDGYESMYAHASELFVKPNERVTQHQVIALSGNTGTSTAPHLHFEIRKDGVPIDPRTMVQPPT